MIRDMGANFIRLAHYQQSELVLDLCDELGLVVWEELPWCRARGGDAALRANARHLLQLMIEQHCNHPSIVFWSLDNEEDWPGIDPGDGQVTVPELMQQLLWRESSASESIDLKSATLKWRFLTRG
jgi:beta-galactosidase